jgi:methyltransferase (TIGR00027 family)
MDPDATKWFRASIVARARFVEDLVIEQVGQGVGQYIILGAGLDSFAQRRAAMAAKLHIFEIDQPGTQAWKKQRLLELGFGIPEWLRFVPVDFEAGSSWWEQLKRAGFDTSSPAIVACTGVSMYLTRDAIMATLRRIAALPLGSTLAMTFILPKKLTKTENRPMQQASEKAPGRPAHLSSVFLPRRRCSIWGRRPALKR